MRIGTKTFFTVTAALLLLISAYAGAGKGARGGEAREKVKLDVMPVGVRILQKDGVQYFETDDDFIKNIDPLYVGYNQAKEFFITNLPRDGAPAGIEFKKPEEFDLPGLQFKNSAQTDIFEARTYESDNFLITSYFPLEYNFADKKFVAAAKTTDANAVVNTSPCTVLCENFTREARKIILTYRRDIMSSFIHRIDGANPTCLLHKILSGKQYFKSRLGNITPEGKIIAAYKIFDKALGQTTVTMYVLK